MDWVFSLFFFLRPLLFCFSLAGFLGFAVPFEGLSGRLLTPVALLPWPVSLSLGPWVSCVSWFSFSSFLSFAHRPVRTPFPGARGSSLPVGVPFPAALPGGLLGAPPWARLLWGTCFFSVLRVRVPSWAWGPFAPPSELPWVSVVGVGPCFGLLFASRSGAAFDYLGFVPSFPLAVAFFSGLAISFPLVCPRQVVCVPCLLFSWQCCSSVLSCSVHMVGSWWRCFIWLDWFFFSPKSFPS